MGRLEGCPALYIGDWVTSTPNYTLSPTAYTLTLETLNTVLYLANSSPHPLFAGAPHNLCEEGKI